MIIRIELTRFILQNTELIERLENLAGNISRQELDDFAGAPEESPVKKGRTTDGWELVDDVSQSEDVDFGPSPSLKSGNTCYIIISLQFDAFMQINTNHTPSPAQLLDP